MSNVNCTKIRNAQVTVGQFCAERNIFSCPYFVVADEIPMVNSQTQRARPWNGTYVSYRLEYYRTGYVVTKILCLVSSQRIQSTSNRIDGSHKMIVIDKRHQKTTHRRAISYRYPAVKT
jgi:hypothetical protein